MPIYEYRCNTCGRRVSLFQRSMSAQTSPLCPHCQGTDLRRLISSFAVVRSDKDAFAGDFDEGDFEGLDENDTDSMLDSAHRLGEKMGVDLDAGFDDDINNMISGDFGDGGGGDDFGV